MMPHSPLMQVLFLLIRISLQMQIPGMKHGPYMIRLDLYRRTLYTTLGNQFYYLGFLTLLKVYSRQVWKGRTLSLWADNHEYQNYQTLSSDFSNKRGVLLQALPLMACLQDSLPCNKDIT